MDPTAPDLAPAGNLPEVTVSELSLALKRTVETAFDRVRVRGEVGGVTRARSGHIYLTLKDGDAVLDTVVWRGVAGRLAAQPEEGLEVVATGKLSTYPGRSKYQMIVEAMAPAGVGALMALLEKRKQQLAGEGLFAPDRKRPLPYLPDTIGVVTSPTGAVIRDILHRLADRFPRHVLLWPVPVQGETAAAEVARAIAGFNALAPDGAVPRPDVLIVARGGGSIEDLWAFNEEAVVRAAAASIIPLISAVGHETDTTLIDFAADVRAPTPTAAAEMAVPVRAELMTTTDGLGRQLFGAARRMLDTRRQTVTALGRILRDPAEAVAAKAQRLDDVGARLDRAARALAERRQARLDRVSGRLAPHALKRAIRTSQGGVAGLGTRLAAGLARTAALRAARLDLVGGRLTPAPLSRETARARDRLTGLTDRADRAVAAALSRAASDLARESRLLASVGYESVLRRGFAVVRDAEGAPVTEAAALNAGQDVSLQLRDGRIGATVTGTPPTKAPAKPRPKPRGTRQGDLF